MNYETPAFEALLMDQEAGASSLLYRFIEIVSALLEEQSNLNTKTEQELFRSLYSRVLVAHPLMAIFLNLSNFVEAKQEADTGKPLLMILNEFKSHLNLNIQLTVRKSVELFSSYKNIFTFSHSSIVRKTLLELKKKQKDLNINITESRPMREGVMLAKVLSRSGIKINLFADAAMERALEMSDLVMVGTDWYWDEGFVNKIGTHAILRIAREKHIPFSVLTDSSKAMNQGPQDWSKDVHASSVIFAENKPNITVYNPYFEAMNYSGVSHFIVDGQLRLESGGSLTNKAKGAYEK